MAKLSDYGLTAADALVHLITVGPDGEILAGHQRAYVASKGKAERAEPDGVVVCGDCGAAPAVCIVDTQRAEGTYPMCAMCANHSVKNRGMRYVMAGERSAGARLAPPPAMAPGSTEPARTPGDHKTQEEN